jgi:outer membrane biosynthesis protein TonB
MNNQESLQEIFNLRLRFQMNSRLRLESLAALSRLFREHNEDLNDELLATMVFALPAELPGERPDLQVLTPEAKKPGMQPPQPGSPGTQPHPPQPPSPQPHPPQPPPPQPPPPQPPPPRTQPPRGTLEPRAESRKQPKAARGKDKAHRGQKTRVG